MLVPSPEEGGVPGEETAETVLGLVVVVVGEPKRGAADVATIACCGPGDGERSSRSSSTPFAETNTRW